MTTNLTPIPNTPLRDDPTEDAIWKRYLSQLRTNVNGVFDVAHGGTGISSYTIGDILYASAQKTLSTLSDVATGNALISGGVGIAPSWGKIALTTHVSGLLPVANGGTAVATAAANTAFAGPTSGGAAAPAFRALVTADMPAGTGTVTSVASNFTGGLISVAGSPITTSGTLAFTVAGTSGGIPYFSGATTWATSGALTNHGVMLGGGAGAAPTAISVGANNTFLKGSTGADPAFSAITLASADFANQGTTVTVLHGNAAGNPSFGAVSLTADVSGTLPVTNGGTGVATLTGIPLGAGTSAFTALDYVPWTTPTFDAANFTGGGSQTWTVASGDITTFAYTIFGKTMTVSFFIATTTVGGTPNAALQIKIPASKTSTKRIFANIKTYNNAVEQTGVAEVLAGNTQIFLYTNTYFSGTNWSASTDNTWVVGSITFQID